jgi:adenine-specific DNA-methyltransferase
MQKRLWLAKKLLKPDGVLIITIDEHEVHHLGMLLEKVFPEYLRYLVTIVISAHGIYKANFARVEEYALYCCPRIGRDVITGSRIDLLPEQSEIDFDPYADEDLTTDLPSEIAQETSNGETPKGRVEIRHARRRGPDSRRSDRPSMFYPIYIDEQAREVIRVGEPLPLDDEPDFTRIDGFRPIWPIDANGEHRRWRWGYQRMQLGIERGEVILGQHNRTHDSWTINLLISHEDNCKKIKTVWRHTSHHAGVHGTSLLDNILGQRGLFPFPKSVYALRDSLAAVVRNRPDALIVDFFAGSATTLHATCLINAEDDGNRRCILVNNNEVGENTARQLNKEGYFSGDANFEAHGIFEQVTRPRVQAIISGRRPDGLPIPGNHLNGRPFAEGFAENVEFYRLDYLDPDDVDLGCQFNALLPSFWLAAGGIGMREEISVKPDFSLPPNSTYGVLFKEGRFRQFKRALEQRTDVNHVWLLTDSEEAYAEMRAALPRNLSVSMLYRDYLRYFRTTTERNI